MSNAPNCSQICQKADKHPRDRFVREGEKERGEGRQTDRDTQRDRQKETEKQTNSHLNPPGLRISPHLAPKIFQYSIFYVDSSSANWILDEPMPEAFNRLPVFGLLQRRMQQWLGWAIAIKSPELSSFLYQENQSEKLFVCFLA